MLLTISNLLHLKDHQLPAAIDDFEKRFAVATEGDRQTLNEVVDQLDSIVFDDYIKRKTSALEDIVKAGVLRSGVDWLTVSKPTGESESSAESNLSEVRPYMYKALLYLVGVHAQISSVSTALLKRTLEALLETLTSVILDCFKQVPRFGMGGMLSVSDRERCIDLRSHWRLNS